MKNKSVFLIVATSFFFLSGCYPLSIPEENQYIEFTDYYNTPISFIEDYGVYISEVYYEDQNLERPVVAYNPTYLRSFSPDMQNFIIMRGVSALKLGYFFDYSKGDDVDCYAIQMSYLFYGVDLDALLQEIQRVFGKNLEECI